MGVSGGGGRERCVKHKLNEGYLLRDIIKIIRESSLLTLCFAAPQDGQSRTIRQFQFTDWPEQGVPKTGEGFIDFIGQVHKTKEQFGQDGPITVHCR